MPEKLDRAKWWLDNGFQLLPCQPGSKSLVMGFGQYRKKIADAVTAGQWFGPGAKANLAVLSPDGFYILDFDKISVFAKWADACPAGAMSYTEATPRGGRHVFLIGTPPAGVKLIEGAEIKRVVLVSPSIIGDDAYKIALESPFCKIDPIDVLSPISEPGHATPRFLQVDEIRKNGNPLSRVNEIKSHFAISRVLQTYRPDLKIAGRGDFHSCLCPFHKDNKPSFWFNDKMGLWGCHACNVRGDVINLYARFEAVNVREAISRMWAVMA